MISVIMCGGSGTRLWPLSRTDYPKQFLSFGADQSLLQKTIKRTAHCTKAHYFITNEAHRFLLAEQNRQLDQSGCIILEPEGKNTAPALAACALQAVADGFGNETMVVLPADHMIQCEEAFLQAIITADAFARDGYIVTLGIKPDQPHTGYGYIQQGEQIDLANEACWIDQFVEKPTVNVAESYVASGTFLWNSGVYVITPKRYLELLQTYAPRVIENTTKALQYGCDDHDFRRLDAVCFSRNPNISIDHAVMEPLCASTSQQSVVIPLECGWSDLGSWQALYENTEKDSQGNACLGDVLKYQVKNSYLHADSRLVAAVGVEDIIVVESADAVLVADRSKTEAVKAVVEQLKQQKRSEYSQHREVFRPWGKYELMGDAQGYCVKKISVDVGASLSLQKHNHRAEHWVVAQGTAEVMCGDECFNITANQSTFIPIGELHSLKNVGETELVIVEVQTGDYLSEEDIIRYHDDYGRA